MCQAIAPGLVELLAIACFIGILNVLNTIFGVCFVHRNKIDVAKVKDDKKTQEKFKYDPNTNPKGDILHKYQRYGFTRIKSDQTQFYIEGEALNDSILESEASFDQDETST